MQRDAMVPNCALIDCKSPIQTITLIKQESSHSANSCL